MSQTGSKSVPLGLRKMRGHLSHFLAVLKPPNMSFMKKCFVQFQFFDIGLLFTTAHDFTRIQVGHAMYTTY